MSAGRKLVFAKCRETYIHFVYLTHVLFLSLSSIPSPKKLIKNSKRSFKVVHVCNLSTWEPEAGGI
jgi:hypothetical protein